MRISQANEYEKIIRESIYQTLKSIPYVESISIDMSQNRSFEKNNNKSIIVEFLPKNKLSIEIHVILFYTENLTIPEIVYEIQEKVQKNIVTSTNFIVRNIDVSVTGVLM